MQHADSWQAHGYLPHIEVSRPGEKLECCKAPLPQVILGFHGRHLTISPGGPGLKSCPLQPEPRMRSKSFHACEWRIRHLERAPVDSFWSFESQLSHAHESLRVIAQMPVDLGFSAVSAYLWSLSAQNLGSGSPDQGCEPWILVRHDQKVLSKNLSHRLLQGYQDVPSD